MAEKLKRTESQQQDQAPEALEEAQAVRVRPRELPKYAACVKLDKLIPRLK